MPRRSSVPGSDQATRLEKLMKVPRWPLWLRVIFLFLGLFFVLLFIRWAIWSMETVVIPRLEGRPVGQRAD